MIDLHLQREENLKAMRSPASIALAVFSIAAVILACVFYDHPLMKQPQVFASLRQHISTQ
jgi:ABC-type molybdate transport system permease subunit